MGKLTARLRHALTGEAPAIPRKGLTDFKMPTVTAPAEKLEALRLLAEHTVQLARIDAEVDAYRAALRDNRLRRRSGDKK